jgi:hypothetical protein
MGRRLPRILLDAATVASALLCVAMLILWARSYTVAYGISHRDPTAENVMLAAESGYLSLTTVTVERTMPPPRPPPTTRPWQFHTAPADPASTHDFRRPGWLGKLGLGTGGFAQAEGPSGAVLFVRFYWCHLWIPAAAFALLPALRLWRTLRRRRAPAPHACRACGYDLRATPDRCPECGTVPATSDMKSN